MGSCLSFFHVVSPPYHQIFSSKNGLLKLEYVKLSWIPHMKSEETLGSCREMVFSGESDYLWVLSESVLGSPVFIASYSEELKKREERLNQARISTRNVEHCLWMKKFINTGSIIKVCISNLQFYSYTMYFSYCTNCTCQHFFNIMGCGYFID